MIRFKFAHQVKKHDFEWSDMILEIGTLTNHTHKHWDTCGITPVMLWLLVNDALYTEEEIDKVLKFYIGIDYADIKVTEWISRLEKEGFNFPDGKPVYKVLKEIFEDTFKIREDA
jgi:hypothetical protein